MIRAFGRFDGKRATRWSSSITVMAILGIVLAGLTTMFQSGFRAEVRASGSSRRSRTRGSRSTRCGASSTARAHLGAQRDGGATIRSRFLPRVPARTRRHLRDQTVATGRSAHPDPRCRLRGTVADYVTSSTPFTYYVPASRDARSSRRRHSSQSQPDGSSTRGASRTTSSCGTRRGSARPSNEGCLPPRGMVGAAVAQRE